MNENSIKKETVEQIATEFIRKRKSTERVEVATVELNNFVWVVRGICPISLGGHPWAEKFEITLDNKGNVKRAAFGLL